MSNSHEKHMFINLISAQAAHQAKALRFGRKFLAAGWSVTLSINLDGVGLLNPQAAPVDCPVSGKPLPVLLKGFLAEGGRALAGAECMKLAGIGQDQLPAGVTLATFEVLEGLVGQDGTRIISY